MSDESGALLYAKMAEVMEAVDRIPKRGRNTFHGYQYATEADVSDAVRRELAKRRIAVFVNSTIENVREWATPKGKPTLLTDVKVHVTFACGDSGAQVTVSAAGTGDDGSDKGTYKAITGAVKYALMKSLLIPTGDDPEDDSRPAGTNTGSLPASKAVQKPSQKVSASKAALVSPDQAKELEAAYVALGKDPSLAARMAKNCHADQFVPTLKKLKG